MTTLKSKQLILVTFLTLKSLIIFGQQTAIDTSVYPVAAVEVKPLFEGKSDSALFRFIGQNIRFPLSARDYVGNIGTAYIYFMLKEDGLLDSNSVKLLYFQPGGTKKEPKPKMIVKENMLNPRQAECLKEAKRVIRLLNNWSPAKVAGNNVKCSMAMPITFKNEGIKSSR